ncbi:FAD/NAD(P)-binding protein [Candidatus Woesearchaeota archaeon]|nr:FAD/NAD(P)-binding protein [Candidatus Woesearchaeota archaeon]
MATKEEIIARNPYLPELKEINYYKRESPDSFTIRLKWKLNHGAGQFIFCSLPGIGEAPISICSYSPEYVELNIREVGNVTNALAKLKKGDKLLVRGPYGTEYPLGALKGKNIIIVGGGCGVAPLKGVIEYIERKREKFGDVSLFFGFRTPEFALFSEQMKSWKKTFKLHISFDKIENPATCTTGIQGFVTQLVDDNVKDSNNAVAVLCGPPIMIEKTAELLEKKGFSDKQIYISAERLMYCGIGKCGRCMIHGKYTCLDGAVFRYDELKEHMD